MNRRNFFTTLAAVASAAVLDPDLALWVPGRVTYSIPSSVAWQSLMYQRQQRAASDLADLFMQSSVLWKKISARHDASPIATRPYRIPWAPVAGGPASFIGKNL